MSGLQNRNTGNNVDVTNFDAGTTYFIMSIGLNYSDVKLKW